MVQSEKILHIKRLKDATAILEQERLEILGDEFGAEMVENDAVFYIRRAKEISKLCRTALNADKRGQGANFSEAMNKMSKADYFFTEAP